MTTRRHIAAPSLTAIATAWLAFAGAAPPAFAQTPAKPLATPAAAPASLDAILKQVALYDGGIESASVWQLRDYVYARKDDGAGRAECEAKLLSFLKSPASQAARTIASRHLRFIASETAVPALQFMLADDKSADLALYALQGIPGASAERALLQSLGVATGPTKIAIVAALGERRIANAVPAIAPLLQQTALAPVAAVALGRIGGEAAASALGTAYGGAAGALKTAIGGALLETANLFELGAQSLPIYERLASDTALPESQRRAALIGRIRSSDPRQAVIAMLADQDRLVQEAAMAQVSSAFFPDTVGKVCAALAGLPDDTKVQLIAALSSSPADCVVPVFLEAAGSQAPAVRLAALKGIGRAGGASTVAFLAERASTARGAEQAAARSALGSLKGRAVDDEIVAQLLRKPADEMAGELLLAVGDRRVYAAKPLVSAALSSPSSAVRSQALKALRTVGTPSDIPAVLDVLLGNGEDSGLAEAEKTVVALAQKIENPDGRSGSVKSRLAGEKRSESRMRLVNLFPLIGDPSALPVLRSHAGDDDLDVREAAVRALASWPTPAAREDLLKLARESRNQTNRLLAIGGFVRVVGLDKYRDPQEAVADLKEAAALSWRPEEQKLILGAVAKFPCQAALDLVNGFLNEPDVKAEAQSAVKTIAARLKKEATTK